MSEGRLFLVPDLGEGLEEATVVEWLVALGDQVALNQPLVTVETAKAEVEIPSPFSGTVAELGGPAGATLKVGQLLARIGGDEAAPAGAAAAPKTEAPAPAAPPDAASARQPTLVGYGHDESLDRSRRRSVAPSAQTPTAATPTGTATRPLAKPPVRKLAHTLGVDLASVAGTGAGGIVTRADVEAAAAPASASAAASSNASVVAAPGAVLADEVIPVRGIRARIVERMTTSRSHIPDATCSVVADCTRLLEVRGALNSAAQRQGHEAVITPFSLLCRLVVQALRANPTLNATYVEDVPEIRIRRSIHLGIGTATARGLLVPVVRDAEHRSTLDLSLEMARLAIGARDGSLAPTELQGSTFTLSNFGALGLDDGIPVINYPEAAILGVGSIKQRPHVVDGVVVARATASLTLAFDHRVGDGAEAGRFLSELRALVVAPELALLQS
ncbi:MAG: pyruvate/2-oxoglutarate dehydrogenase complex, dihydrolipoamide acyltransferase component [Acidimicrobiia bacterium]|nr:pyruvate/2-oxoglutarate dehydrogenase complex, dihydrolipoamide acyltransferase component [Acidimicrobiia bacterium]